MPFSPVVVQLSTEFWATSTVPRIFESLPEY
jgi:hypothetical protein